MSPPPLHASGTCCDPITSHGPTSGLIPLQVLSHYVTAGRLIHRSTPAAQAQLQAEAAAEAAKEAQQENVRAS